MRGFKTNSPFLRVVYICTGVIDLMVMIDIHVP